ncbi:MAG: hypothetical protein VKL39_09470 [Leptolyngbyaceae bacterium]|nr:hypothetical protein [Leptolyngbyaceae bacterium]
MQRSKGTGFRNVLLSFAIAAGTSLLVGAYQPLRAETELIVIDIPLSERVSSFELVSSSEQRIANEITQLFRQSSGVDTVQVSVLTHRNGEVIPLMTTVVSRSQWQQLPQVSAWTRYNNPQALLERHDQERVVALSPTRPGGSRGIGLQDTAIAQLDRDLDEGRLSGAAAQRNLSDLD